MLIAIAANAVHFHLDDTGNRILDQQPIEKPNRNGKGSRMRSGVYTSGVIATLENGEQIVLFKTNIGHAGEWIDEILAHRDPALPAPLLMSDALSSNEPTKNSVSQHNNSAEIIMDSENNKNLIEPNPLDTLGNVSRSLQLLREFVRMLQDKLHRRHSNDRSQQ